MYKRVFANEGVLKVREDGAVRPPMKMLPEINADFLEAPLSPGNGRSNTSILQLYFAARALFLSTSFSLLIKPYMS